MNNTVFSAGALLELYLETGEPQYGELSEICLASVFTNVYLWECDYGHAEHYSTFFGMLPLDDAPYTAAHEEVERLPPSTITSVPLRMISPKALGFSCPKSSAIS